MGYPWVRRHLLHPWKLLQKARQPLTDRVRSRLHLHTRGGDNTSNCLVLRLVAVRDLRNRHRLAGRTWRDTTSWELTKHAAPIPTLMCRKPKQRARPILSALASPSRATYAPENIAPTFQTSPTSGSIVTGEALTCGRTDWMIAPVLRAQHQLVP